ncbi:MAG TPA: VWA domain-containing protein [Verrucomicrobiae bacterium]|nr:VWA domain-containing protein [Verrucomicrobiae bacterium]
MRRIQRGVPIFGLSLIDLFACATGAYIVIAFVLWPYYLKSGQLKESLTQATQQTAALRAAAQAARAEAARQASRAAQFEGENRRLIADNQALNQQLDEARQIAFLGITTKAKRLILLVDMSGSISENGYTPIMQRVLNQMIDIVDEDYWIQMIGFRAPSQRNVSLYSWLPEGRLAAMTGAMKTQANAWIAGLGAQFGGGTPTGFTLNKALDYSDAQAIFLFTDGEPTDAPKDAIVNQVTARNAGRAEIHCVAIGNYSTQFQLQQFLIPLSAQNRGEFIGVTR